MKKQLPQQRWSRLIALLLVGAISPVLFNVFLPERSFAQTPAQTSVQTEPNTCSQITVPLTPDEEIYARAAWQYFLNNYQPATGFANAVGGYPSGTLWDMGNYLMALNAARQLNLVNQADFDNRLNQFLNGLNQLPLFENTLPNKVYNAQTGQMTDYGNNPSERGLGWSALDIGRLLAALHVMRTCHPQYADWIRGTVEKWQIERSLQDGQLFGATVLSNNETLLVQEGRLGYEEYAVRGYELWGHQASEAVSLEPFQFVDIYGVQVPVDTRDYERTNANNYVVSESYILDAIEFGLQGELAEYATRVLEVQRRRYEATGELTAVSEDNIDRVPYFLYNTVYANGTPWATITDTNQPHPDLRTISTKAAFGWRYLYPDNAYAQQVFDAVKDLRSPDGGGFYAGLYQATNQPNVALTGNTNGLILEILYYKARGNRPLIGSDRVSTSTGQSTASVAASSPTPSPTPLPTPSTAASGTSTAPVASPSLSSPSTTPSPTAPVEPAAIAVAPIPSVGNLNSSAAPRLTRPLTLTERRYAEAAWQYFQANYQPQTGLVRDRNDLDGATLWGLGDYLAALHAARSLDLISAQVFDQRVRLLLGALSRLDLAGGELPNRGYDVRSLQPVDYGGNPIPEGTGWSALDIGRMLAALYTLKSSYPQYTAAVDQIALDWSYLRVVRDGRLLSGNVTEDDNGRSLTRVTPETRLGYEEYAARSFQLWGFRVDRAAVGDDYQNTNVEGFDVPTQRAGTETNTAQYTVSTPFVRYGLEFGFDPQMRSLIQPILQAEAERHRRTGTFAASGTIQITQAPYVVQNTVVGQGQAWATLTSDGAATSPNSRMVSTATAFAYYALFPDNEYARQLWEATTDLYNPVLGYYEGFYERTGSRAIGFTGNTNSIILQSLLYRVTQQPIISSTAVMNSAWWQAVAEGDPGRGLPEVPAQQAHFISDTSGSYWATGVDSTRSQRSEANRQENQSSRRERQ